MPDHPKGLQCIRHRIIIEKYENLSCLRTAESRTQGRASDLSRMSACYAERPYCPQEISAEREGESHEQSLRAKARCQTKASLIWLVRTKQTQQQKPTCPLQPFYKGQASKSARVCETERGDCSISAYDCGGLAGDSRSTQISLPLLPQEEDTDNGPCYPLKQGREACQGKHCSSMSVLQLLQKRQDNQTFVGYLSTPGQKGLK